MAPNRLGPALLLTAIASVAGCASSGPPLRPEALVFPEHRGSIPDPEALRFELRNGIPVYALPRPELPLVTVRALFRGGRDLVQAHQAGLSELVAEVWATGGAGSRSGPTLDALIERLGAEVEVHIDDTWGWVQVDLLERDLDLGLEVLGDLLLRPRFDPGALEQAREVLAQAMAARNDDPIAVWQHEWTRLLWGADSWRGRRATTASLASLSAEDCRALVAAVVGADNLVVAAAGAFDRDDLRTRLEGRLGAVAPLARPLPEPPPVPPPPGPGVYLLDLPGVDQAEVTLGHRSLPPGHADELALRVANEVVGGGGFTSRLGHRIRAQEGLAYWTESRLEVVPGAAGELWAAFITRAPTCAFAAALAHEILLGVRREPVPDTELATACAGLASRIEGALASPLGTVVTFAMGELAGRPRDHWRSLRARLAALTPADVRAAAERHIRPDELVILVVGDADQILAGTPDHPQRLEDLGAIRRLPLRDPLTLEPLD
jgi:predicted Zn-dependent peptidase